MGSATLCRALHISEDTFAGFNHVLRGGKVKRFEYIEAGKGRDMSFDAINAFDAKVGQQVHRHILLCLCPVPIYFTNAKALVYSGWLAA